MTGYLKQLKAQSYPAFQHQLPPQCKGTNVPEESSTIAFPLQNAAHSHIATEKLGVFAP